MTISKVVIELQRGEQATLTPDGWQSDDAELEHTLNMLFSRASVPAVLPRPLTYLAMQVLTYMDGEIVENTEPELDPNLIV